MAILKKVDAVKEALITEVSNDADMSSRRLIEATLQLDGYTFFAIERVYFTKSVFRQKSKIEMKCLTKFVFHPPTLYLKPCKFSLLV